MEKERKIQRVIWKGSFAEAEDKNGCEYVLVGGYAAIINGVNRTTGDMDIFVNRTEDNARKIIDTINEFGFGFLNFSKEDIMNSETVLQLGVSPI